MTATVQKVLETLQEHLETEIQDLNSDRDNNDNWVLVKRNQFGYQEYPKIHLQEISGEPHNRLSMGSDSRQIDNLVQISVFNNVYGSFDVTGDNEDNRPDYVLGFLKDRVIKEINSNQSKWRDVEDCSIDYFETIGNQPLNTTGNETIGWVIQAELRTIQ